MEEDKKIEQLPVKAIISKNDLILIVDSEDSNKNKVTTLESFERKSMAKATALSIAMGE